MSRNAKYLLLGAGVLAVLTAAVLFLTLSPAPGGTDASPSPVPSPTSRPLTDETYLTVTKITLTLANGETYNMSPIAGEKAEYQMNTPVGAFPWNRTPVRDTATAALRIITDRLLEENVSSERMRQYGLDKPVSRVRLDRTDGTMTEVLIGNQAPIGSYAYACRAGDTSVYLITSFTAGRLTRSISDLRDYSLLKTYTVTDENGEQAEDTLKNYLRTLTLQETADSAVELHRRTDTEYSEKGLFNRYYMTRPGELEGNDYFIESNIITPILTLKPERVAAENPSDWSVYGLDNPVILSLSDVEGWELVLHIGSIDPETGGRFLRVEGTDIVLLDAEGGDYSFLGLDPFYMRNTVAWGGLYNITTVSEVVYEFQGVQRSQSIVSPPVGEVTPLFASEMDGVKIEENSARNLYIRVMDIRLSGPNNDGIPPGDPEASIRIILTDGTEHILRLYSLNSRHYAYTVDGVDQYGYSDKTGFQRVWDAIGMIDRGEAVTRLS